MCPPCLFSHHRVLLEKKLGLPHNILKSHKMSQFLNAKSALEHLATYESRDGLSASELMNSTKHGGLTYNDFLLLPGHIDFSASEVSTESRITRNVVLKTPFMSSPMDTVTETAMAVNMAVSRSLQYIF